MNQLRLAGLMLCVLFLAGCSVGTVGNDLIVSVQTDPEPPQVGKGKIVITVLSANKQPLDGLDVEISFGMSSMTMKTQDGQAADQGQGRYSRALTFDQKGDSLVRIWVNRNGRTLKIQDFSFSIN